MRYGGGQRGPVDSSSPCCGARVLPAPDRPAGPELVRHAETHERAIREVGVCARCGAPFCRYARVRPFQQWIRPPTRDEGAA